MNKIKNLTVLSLVYLATITTPIMSAHHYDNSFFDENILSPDPTVKLNDQMEDPNIQTRRTTTRLRKAKSAAAAWPPVEIISFDTTPIQPHPFINQTDLNHTKDPVAIKEYASSVEKFFEELKEDFLKKSAIARELRSEVEAPLQAQCKARLEEKKDTVRRAHKAAEAAASQRKKAPTINLSSDERKSMHAIHNLYREARAGLEAELFLKKKLLKFELEQDEIDQKSFQRQKASLEITHLKNLKLIDQDYNDAIKPFKEKFKKPQADDQSALSELSVSQAKRPYQQEDL